MTESTATTTSTEGVPAPPPDAENPALIDALKTFQITVLSAFLFFAASAVIIMLTRLG